MLYGCKKDLSGTENKSRFIKDQQWRSRPTLEKQLALLNINDEQIS